MADETTPAPLSDAFVDDPSVYEDGRLRARIAELEATLAAYREIVAAVATSNPYGSWYPATSGPAGVVCRWCMKRAMSPQQCQHDAECGWSRARALLADTQTPGQESE